MGSAHLLVSLSLSLSQLNSSQVLLLQPQSPSHSGPSPSFTQFLTELSSSHESNGSVSAVCATLAQPGPEKPILVTAQTLRSMQAPSPNTCINSHSSMPGQGLTVGDPWVT